VLQRPVEGYADVLLVRDAISLHPSRGLSRGCMPDGSVVNARSSRISGRLFLHVAVASLLALALVLVQAPYHGTR